MTFRFSIITVALVLITIPSAVYSQQVPAGPQLIPDTGMIGNCPPNNNNSNPGGNNNPINPDCCNFRTGAISFDCIPLYLSYLIKFVFGLAGGFALIEIIKGGYEYALSGLQQFGGLPDKEAGKKRITNAILGLIVVVFTFLIVDTIVSAFFAP